LKKNKELGAGDDIDSRCLKCKDVTNHTIVAMVADKVVKVQCNVCHSLHNYRPVQGGVKALVRRNVIKRDQPAKEVKTAAGSKSEKRFHEMIEGRDQRAAIPYAMNVAFQTDDLVDHPVFGIGLVVKTISPNKMEVVFKEASKILICAPKT